MHPIRLVMEGTLPGLTCCVDFSLLCGGGYDLERIRRGNFLIEININYSRVLSIRKRAERTRYVTHFKLLPPAFNFTPHLAKHANECVVKSLLLCQNRIRPEAKARSPRVLITNRFSRFPKYLKNYMACSANLAC